MTRRVRGYVPGWHGILYVSLLMSGCAKSPDTYQGYMEGHFMYLSAPVAGNLDKLPVERGNRIAVGTPLFAIDSPDLAYSTQRQYHEWQSSLNQLKDIGKGKRPSEIDALKAQLDQARASAALSAQQLSRSEADYRIQAISREKLDADMAAAAVDSARVRELASQLRTAELPARSDQLQSQQENASGLQADYERKKKQYEQQTVSAVGDGVVVDTFYQPGEWVPAGSPVVKILLDHAVKLRFFVPETRLSRLHVGDTVHLTCDGCEKAHTAKISYIAPEAEYTPPVIYSNDARAKLVFMIEAQPDESSAEVLHPGLPVEVTR